ncbi:general substrate transporter [Parathielavia hyrcaniae]|uniref:General substrate transporter n=1 Tax=Parathielavia hyrcaniae TaxID=113614 RepID=A0AAN6Q7G3_9PEZI|nr:general substrate transporter [Parathielavia hyrcaniae]
MGLSKQVWYNWYAGLVAAGCMILMGYDSSVFNSVQASQNWKSAMGDPDPHMVGLVNTVYTIGAIVTGWFLSGPTSDYFGRRIGMAIGCMVTVFATFLQAFPPASGSLACFMVGRVFIGVGTALATTAGPIYIGEVTASEIRGKVMSFWQMFFSVGSFLAYWINFACARNRANLGHWDWKMVVIFQLMMPLIICAQLPFLPESPRWLIAKKNDYEGAKAALMRLRSTEEEVDAEILSIREAVAYENEAAPRKREAYVALIKDKAIRKRIILAFIINVGQQLTGQGTLNSYSSTIYQSVFNNIDTVNLINALNGTLGIVFTLNATWTVDRFGRKWLFMVGATGMAVCTMLIAVVGLTTPDINGAKTYGVGVGIATLAFAFAFFFKPSWGAVVWIYTAEIFPMHVRAQGTGMSIQMQNVANTIFQQFFPIFFRNEGLKVFFFFMTTNVLLVFFTYFCLPETKNVTLEQMDTLFGGVDHVAKGAGLIEDAEHTENKPESVALETVSKKQESV